MSTKTEMNYVDTLYLYHNFGDYSEYTSTVSYFLEQMCSNADSLGMGGGYSWYKFENYRIGIMEYDQARKSNTYDCVIQYNSLYLMQLDSIHDLHLPFGGSPSDYPVKRIDLTKICHDNYLEYEVISNYKTKHIIEGAKGKVETVYLGKRSSGNVFRYYNKTLELNVKKDYEKIELLSSVFGSIENLYTYELEMGRSFLRNRLDVDTLADYDKIVQAYHKIVGTIKFFVKNDKNIKNFKNNHYDDICTYQVAEFKEYAFKQQRKYKPSFDYLIDGIKKQVESFYKRSNAVKEDYIKVCRTLLYEAFDGFNINLEAYFKFDDNYKYKVEDVPYDGSLQSEHNMYQLKRNKLIVNHSFTYSI